MEESKTVKEIARSFVDACTDTSMKKVIGRAKRALHTSESQLRSDMYPLGYQNVVILEMCSVSTNSEQASPAIA